MAAPGVTAITLSRALRLLEESNDATGLAGRLGVAERDLRRLFTRHLGATPAEVQRMRRLQVARELRTETGGAISLRLPFHPPLDFEALCGFLAVRALPGLEEVRDGAWRRRVSGGWLEVRRGGRRHLTARMAAGVAPGALQIAARLHRVFDLRADPRPIVAHLSRDLTLKKVLSPGVRIPGTWEPFEMAVRAILGQQISVGRARAMAIALIDRFGAFPSPAQLAKAELRGMPAVRARAIAELARAVLAGTVRLDGSQDLDAAVASLCALPGIGDWTAQVIALRALGEPDAFPAADLGLCQALALSPRALRERAEAWRPWRGYAAAAVWLS
jgi:AraC family transcriptional regulator of adaptative response / DNA-3-methyladenine glycosylase II